MDRRGSRRVVVDAGLRDRGRSEVTMRSSLGLAVLFASAAAQAAAPDSARTAFTADDLVRMERVSDPQVSPAGREVVYVQRSTDMEANRGRTDLWLVPLADAGAPRRLTTHAANDSSPRWLPGGRELLFLSDRSGSSQVWRL